MTRLSGPPANLESGLRVFLGHQSVGAGIVEGLTEIGHERIASVPAVARDRLPDAYAGEPILVHSRIGNNRDPSSKLEAFAASLDQGPAGMSHLALLKFCYVDVSTIDQAEGLFAEYVRQVAQLTDRYPTIAIGHVTVPLRSVPDRGLDLVRRLVRGPHPELMANQARERFNESLRTAYGGSGLLFDLAFAESRRPDGSRAELRLGQQPVPMLLREYTDDGGHLNRLGRRNVGLAFLGYLEKAGVMLSQSGS